MNRLDSGFLSQEKKEILSQETRKDEKVEALEKVSFLFILLQTFFRNVRESDLTKGEKCERERKVKRKERERNA